jgi:hypothetical protein
MNDHPLRMRLHPRPPQGGVLDVDPNTPSTITAFGPGYIDKCALGGAVVPVLSCRCLCAHVCADRCKQPTPPDSIQPPKRTKHDPTPTSPLLHQITTRGKEVIVGLQTDQPLKRAIKPLGGINMVKNALEAFGHK